MENKEVKKYVLIGVFLVLLYVCYLILSPFLTAILSSFILAYILYPIYKRINKHSKKDYISAGITILIALVIIILPLIIVGNILVHETTNLYQQGSFQKLGDIINKFTQNPAVMSQLQNSSEKIFEFLSSLVSKIITHIPETIVLFLVTIITTFYLLISGESFLRQIKRLIPFKNKEGLVKKVGETTYSIINGFFMIAIIEFIICSISFSLLGIEGAFIWAAIAAFTSLLPIIGPFLLVFIPLVIINVVHHSYVTAILLGVTYIAVAYVENYTRPKIIGDRAKMHPVIILIGIIGGIRLFGLIGMIAGPLILSIMMILIENYYQEYLRE